MSGIKEIAKITGLSVATISRVLNNSTVVSPKTRDKVLQVAQRIDYQPNIMAAGLRSGISKIIGVIVPEINNYFFSSIINGIEQKVSDSKYNIIIAQSHESQKKELAALQSFRQLKVDGILMSVSEETTETKSLEKFVGAKIPFVFFDRIPNMSSISSVALDDYQGALMATQHLIDIGCKHIIHISGNQKVSIFKRRKEGYKAALAKNTHTIAKDNNIELIGDTDKDRTTIEELLNNHPSIDGFFAHGDESGLYLINILKTLDIDIPKKVKVIGFGNTEYSALTNPAISTINQKSVEMGALAAEMLLQNIENDTIVHTQVVLEPELVIRNSTKKNSN